MARIEAFTAEHVSHLTGLSIRQLYHWDRISFFSPELAVADRAKLYSRIYSFKDVVGLRTIAKLYKEFQVPLPQLKLIARWLAEHPESSWTRLRFFVSGRKVYFKEQDIDSLMAASPKDQTAFPIEMREIMREVEEAVEEMSKRKPDDIGRIRQHRYVSHNTPVLAGTRVPTSVIYRFHEGGYSVDAIIKEYPDLTREDIRAAVEYEKSKRQKRAV